MTPALQPTFEVPPTPLDRALVSAFLEKIPDFVSFKDRASRFIAVSHSLVRALGGRSPADIIGRTDFDFFDPAHAQAAFDDEQEIIRTGREILGKSEKCLARDGTVTWLQTNKLPLRNAAGEIVGTFGLSKDVTPTREMELALDDAHKELVDASRMSGMAEVATGVLHNVGNVLTSLNVSAAVIATGLRQSKAESLGKLGSLLREHQPNLASFLTDDPKGRRVPEFLASLARHATDERARLLQEIGAIQKNIDHIMEIVSMQQTYATMLGTVEPLDPTGLMEDALRMNADSLHRHEVQIERDFQPVPAILGEKAKVLQILVNLIRNARTACEESQQVEKRLVLRICPGTRADRVRLIVADNGVGIPADILTRIFAHGFTTRANGHGFGLHSAANAAREMKGTLTVESAGAGRGATFILDLPVSAAVSAAS
ncbi:ATP-binding protein [Horticoccus sp. 23ND18S-11]|uniref:ATP-binding protein n=1 Tax=Horticoccus sp. 23ND18S-11 TaxID=3391832 RepID=UPI0039C8FB05